MKKKDNLVNTNNEKSVESLDFFQIVNQFFRSESLNQFMSEFDTMFNESFPYHHIHVNTYETDKNYVVDLRIPPVKKEQVKLELSDQFLTISITNREEINEFNENSSTFRNFTSLNSLSRTIQLPYPVMENEIKTTFKDGSLIVMIPKKSNQILLNNDF